MSEHQFLLKPDSQDMRDFIYRSPYKIAPELPESVDLRDHASPVVNQGNLGSCTANAIVSGLREYLELAAGETLVRLSRLFLYYKERELEGTIDEDSGAELRDGMKVLQKIGVCPEEDMPYEIGRFTEAPSPQAIRDAAPYRIREYHRINSLFALKSALAEGLPVVIGIEIYESFVSDKVATTGKVPLPEKGERQLGGHAVLVTGYQDTGATSGYLTVKNSWGEKWGDKGYFYLRYPVFQRLAMDMWTGR